MDTIVIVNQSKVSRARFMLDREMIERAVEYLGIKHPVRVRLHSGGGSNGGNHRHHMFNKANGRGYETDPATGKILSGHDITIAAHSDARRASQIVWHELQHAVQYEADPEMKRKSKAERTDSHGRERFSLYYQSSYEVDARAAESNHDTVFALAFEREITPEMKAAYYRKCDKAWERRRYESTRYGW